MAEIEGRAGRVRAWRRGVSRRGIAIGGLFAMLAYIVIVGWPYLQSTFVRDAAVTTWIATTSSLVGGYVKEPLYPGNRIGADGRIATVVDVRADTTVLARAQAELARVRARHELQSRVVEVERHAFEARRARADGFKVTFIQNIDAALAATNSNLAFASQQLVLARAELVRKEALIRTGHGSQTAVDSSSNLVVDYQRLVNDLTTAAARLNQRRAAAVAGYFLLDDGTDMSDALNTLDDARSKLMRAVLELESLQAEVEAGQKTVEAATQTLERQRESAVTGPPGALVWSLISAPGAPVIPGAPVASWVDCNVMLIDVPASDVEIALLNVGDTAYVILEGESERRVGKVMLLRGSAAAIGSHDLAALAKGRRPGLGQALVRLQATPNDLEHCPIGHAAYVDFPSVRFLDVVRARLRL